MACVDAKQGRLSDWIFRGVGVAGGGVHTGRLLSRSGRIARGRRVVVTDPARRWRPGRGRSGPPSRTGTRDGCGNVTAGVPRSLDGRAAASSDDAVGDPAERLQGTSATTKPVGHSTPGRGRDIPPSMPRYPPHQRGQPAGCRCGRGDGHVAAAEGGGEGERRAAAAAWAFGRLWVDVVSVDEVARDGRGRSRCVRGHAGWRGEWGPPALDDVASPPRTEA